MASAGTVAFFMLDNAAGILTNLQPYLDDTSVPNDTAMLDVSAFGTSAKAFVVGQTGGGQIQVKGPYNSALHLHIGSLIAAQGAGTASHSYLWGPGGSVSGQAKVSGECLVAGYTPSASVGGRVEWTATLQQTGAITSASF